VGQTIGLRGLSSGHFTALWMRQATGSWLLLRHAGASGANLVH
jgi:hypothetical protein